MLYITFLSGKQSEDTAKVLDVYYTSDRLQVKGADRIIAWTVSRGFEKGTLILR